MVILTILLIAALVLGIFYVISFWNASIANKVDFIFLAVINLEPKRHQKMRIPDKVAELIKKILIALRHRRNLYKNRREAKRIFRQSKKSLK